MAKLCKSKKVVDSKVNPKKWYYGLEHCRELNFSALPSGESIIPLNYISDSYEEVLGYIHITNGGADPTPAGLTKLGTGDAGAAADVAALLADIKASIEAGSHADFFQLQTSATGLEALNQFIGLITEEDAADGAAELSIAVGQQSFGGALGILSEDGASASFAFEFLDQAGDATGNVSIEKFLIGLEATITMSLTDTSREKFEELFVKPLGGTYENGSDKLIGFGTAAFFQSLMTRIGKLIGADANATDRSNDWQMLAVPNPSSINFNKELQVIECEFVSAFDNTMPEAINIFSIGDKTKIDYSAL